LPAEIPEDPTSLHILPHFTATGTPHFDTNSKGVIAGLRLSTTRGEIVRAVLEGVTYEMALNASVLGDCGAVIESFRAIGGGAKSPIWMQLKADRSEEHTSELQSQSNLVCRLLLEKKNIKLI